MNPTQIASTTGRPMQPIADEVRPKAASRLLCRRYQAKKRSFRDCDQDIVPMPVLLLKWNSLLSGSRRSLGCKQRT
jgi:hypothetical protein